MLQDHHQQEHCKPWQDWYVQPCACAGGLSCLSSTHSFCYANVPSATIKTLPIQVCTHLRLHLALLLCQILHP